MELTPGTTLGPYEIISPIGAGGMGEVFKARDTRLDRIVAVKVMPKYIASREDLRARFEREARTVSNLKHPNICVLYDIGKQDGTDFMVLEYLEGETLAARIARGPMPLDQLLKFATQIADALDRAHRSGVSHRDVKPANVMITRDGCKVLDFGLAKTAAKVIAPDDPTLTAALTSEGTILGTPQYMAPEQYEGKEADARSDIFAFGCVLYEMVTGKRCFDGKTRVSVIAAVLGADPKPMSALVPLTPPALERSVKRCLAKDPEDRYQSIRDVVLDLRTVGEGGGIGRARAEAGVRPALAWIAVAIGTLALGGAITWWLKPAPPVTHVVSRFSYTLPEGQNFTGAGRHTIALSPNGTKLVYVANQQLYLRAMDRLDAQAIRGTNEDPIEPVFSPDGQWLAYFVPAEGEGASPKSRFVLNKIPVAGGAPVTLGQLASAPYGATWRNETIAFGINTESVASVQAIPESGGTLHTIFDGDPGKERLMQPQLLPDGKHLMFVSVPRTTATGGEGGEGQIVVQSLGGKKDRRTLVAAGTDPRVLPAGQLVYIHDGKLLAVPFDIGRVAVTGGPVSILEGVAETISGQFAVSAEGALAFRPGGVSVGKRLLVWVDWEGHEQPISAKARVYVYPRISPDGTKIAFSSADDENDIWIFALAKETLTRLTFGPAFELYDAWTPDSKYVLFSSGPVAPAGVSTPLDIFRKTADGTGPTEALTRQMSGGYPQSVSPDGKSLIFRRYFPNPSAISGLYLLPLDPTGEAHALLADPKFSQTNGEISPNGHWIAYDSNESGRSEVYVRPFPAVDSGRWQISSEGGTKPMWSRSGGELFFAAADHLAVVPVSAGTTFTYGKQQQLLDTRAYYIASAGRTFDISPDGKRLLMIKTMGGGGTTDRPSIVVVSHWFDEVKERTGSK
jgi:Tol biopolymer transport system component/tRNA A-37 threonylcarbamoyl transferase component Bud32